MQMLNSSQETEKYKRAIERAYVLRYISIIKLSHSHRDNIRIGFTINHIHKQKKWVKTYSKTAPLGRVISAKMFCVFDHQGNTRNPNMLLESFKKNTFESLLR